MSSQGLPTLELDVRLRRTETVVAVVASTLAVAAPWLLASFAFELSIVAAVVVPAGFWRAGWIGRQRQIIRIVWQADGRWFLTDAHGRTCEAVLRADTRINTKAIWLRWDIQLDRPHSMSTRASNHASTNPVSTNLMSTSRSMLLASGDVSEPALRRWFVRLRMDPSRPPAQMPTVPAS